ncbi:MAG TPA: SCP2 sterol-binding domain-containing protein [Acidimicrobiales bacterium]|nr:SCP2 sterol-binding domain-containing protein [Acidimicrobiales bacterium]
MAFPFLSEEWVEAAHELRAQYGEKGPPVGQAMRLNLLVTDVPFGDGDIEAHMDSTDGSLMIDRGHLDDPDLKVTVPYATAKAILVEGNTGAAMQAFMNGQIQIEGDMSKLMMALQGAPPDPSAQEFATRLREITE